MDFSELGLSEELLRAVADAGYNEPTAIQEQAIPIVLMGRDVLGSAQTGTGKTASFTLPMIDILAAGRARARMPRTLILEPTRELAAQVAQNFETYGKYHKLSKALIIGGVSMDEQFQIIDRGVDVLIATPGRLIDHFDRGALILNDVKVLVIDEADRMLDMGFIPDIERIVSLIPKMRQTLLFSATMPPEIRKLAERFLMNPKEISVAPPATPAGQIIQHLVEVKGGGRHDRGDSLQKRKREVLRKLIEGEGDEISNALIFCNRKRDVDILHRSLSRHGYTSAALHGDMTQSVRTETLEKFRDGKIPLLACSDVAARGLDITGLSHVFNFDVPTHAEDYVHRIGRTGRAGQPGRAFTLSTGDDKKFVDGIEKLIGGPIPRATVDGASVDAAKATNTKEPTAEVAETPKADKPAQEPREPQEPQVPQVPRERNARSSRSRNEKTPAEQSRPEQKERQRNREPDAPVVGMGDHVPAFLMAGSKPKKAKSPSGTKRDKD